MKSKPKGAYNTKQSCEILSYIKDNEGKHLTAQDIVDHFRRNGINIGSATVYRRLDRLTGEGLVNKYIIDDKSPACYEYIGTADCCQGNCYHMKCENCGRLFHLGCHEIDGFFKHVSDEHGFVLDPKRTVFYGFCTDCAGKEE